MKKRLYTLIFLLVEFFVFCYFCDMRFNECSAFFVLLGFSSYNTVEFFKEGEIYNSYLFGIIYSGKDGKGRLKGYLGDFLTMQFLAIVVLAAHFKYN